RSLPAITHRHARSRSLRHDPGRAALGNASMAGHRSHAALLYGIGTPHTWTFLQTKLGRKPRITSRATTKHACQQLRGLGVRHKILSEIQIANGGSRKPLNP